jgi:hypothetical protein
MNMTRTRTMGALALALLTSAAVSSKAHADVSPEFGSYTPSPLTYFDAFHKQYGEWTQYVTYFDKSDHWGNSLFAAGYRTYGNSSAKKNATTVATSAYAGFTADATIFGSNVKMLEVYASASTNARPVQTKAGLQVLVKGITVYSPSTTTGYSWNWSQSLFSLEWSKSFLVAGWLPVTVSAKVSGSANAGFGATLNPLWMRAGVNGGAGLYAQARGSVGVSWLLGAAAWANLTLVQPQANFSAVQSWELKPSGSGCAITYWRGAGAALTINSLGGNVKAQAQALTGKFTDTIFSWSGFTTTYPLLPNMMTATVVTDPSIKCPTVGT